MNPALATIGHNNPPDHLEGARIAMADLSRWLADNPVITHEEQAREGKAFVDRCRATLGELEDKRTEQVAPLNHQVADINASFKAVSAPLKEVFGELRNRLTAYAEELERIKAQEAERLRQEAIAQQEAARAAEAAKQEAIDNAANGELGVDVTQVVVSAHETQNHAIRAERMADRAERGVNVRICGGFSGRAASLRTTEILSVTNAVEAIKETGMTDGIEAAILTAARDFRKRNGRLPNGINTQTKRSI